MRVAVYQFAPIFGDKEKNLKRIETALEQVDADLVVFPELCTTGYQFISDQEVNSLCEPIPEGPTVQHFIKLCREKGIFIVAGIGEIFNTTPYNSAVLVGPEGFIGLYRKVHLFYEEKKWFQPGDLGFRVWDIGIAKIGIMICFDWIFPEAARSLALQGAELICHPVNLVLPYCQDAMITRSIENGVYTVTANRVGSEERGGRKRLIFTGKSQVVGPRGEILFRLKEEDGIFQITEIDTSLASEKYITDFNHILNDRRPDQYIN